MGREEYKDVKAVAKKSLVTKTFKILSSVAAGIVGTIGSVVVLATSTVSGIGYYDHDKIINLVQEVATKINNSMNSTINIVVERFNNSITNLFGGKNTIPENEIPIVVQTINDEFKQELGISLPANVISTLTDSLNSLVQNGSVQISLITSEIGGYLTNATTEIQTHITSVFDNLITTIYGEKVQNSDGTINYSKLYIWKIVFISTISVVSVLVLSGLLYLICYGIDKIIKRKHVKQVKEAIKKI